MYVQQKVVIVSMMDTVPIAVVFDVVSIPVDVIMVLHVSIVIMVFVRLVHRE
jgi:hypothetical protein